MAQLNFFNNFEVLYDAVTGGLDGNNSLHLNMIYMPGSLSFNKVFIPIRKTGTSSQTLGLSFGLYSLNGSTLSLANSASLTTNLGGNQTSWMTLATSATQNISQGNWWFAVMSSTTGSGTVALYTNATSNDSNNLVNLAQQGFPAGGPFVRGMLSVSTNAMPSSIATSDCSKEGKGTVSTSAGLAKVPCVIISA